MESSDGTGEPGYDEDNGRSECRSSGRSAIDGSGSPDNCAGNSDDNVRYCLNGGGSGESSDRDESKFRVCDESTMGTSSGNSAGRRVDFKGDEENSEHVERVSGRDSGILAGDKRESVDIDGKPEGVGSKSVNDEDGDGSPEV